ncbi:SusC/RagA family TonB-linked outer membrane protein [Hymenobacter psychrotolerans]|uniref:TonB-linked outer membrane protein, SusC/RagA family n=1 Tax=Hymenobacter psychrotolerans DSM 18569 TaxID=1121959 RepID=A0A1M7DEG9_9BACT|nr:TonB-dependent receptor [Hymenobacter psychrotolerans]SHL77936.1 TonB-linked outer membrane protein, SusC/RagA family [Hymenobacter psychrotolerans DSM 18569]
MKRKLLLLAPLMVCAAAPAWAQQRRVQGVVKSDKGEALPGVTVVVKGTTNGASTDGDGRFSLSLPEGTAATLSISYIGYVSQDVPVGSKTDFEISLKEDSKVLDDVVVIGYQAVPRRDVTGSVSSVSAQQIKDIPVNSAAEALTGRLAGVQLTSAEGTPGNLNVQVRVRGGGSITQDNSPLYVVDGIQIENALSVIAPQDIASVDVLKDASATAIYGARGANGVVIITTKKGIEGRTVVSYNGFAGFRRISSKLDVLNPAQYLDYQFERASVIGNSSGGLTTFKNLFGSSNFQSDTISRARNSPFLNWQDEVFGRDAFQQTHNVSIAGGVKGTTYSLSLTRNEEDGIQRGSDYVRNLINFRFDTKASERLKVGMNVRFNDQGTNGAGTSTTGSNTTSRLRNTVQYQPLSVPRADGSVIDISAFDPEFFETSTLVNPVIAIDNEYRNDKRRTLNIGANAAFQIMEGLTFRSTAGFDITNRNLSTFNGRYSPTIRQASGGYANLPFATITTETQETLNNSNVLDYSKKTGLHSFGVLLGHEIYQQKNVQQYIQTNFLPLDITAERALANINQGVLPAGQTAQPVLPQTSIPQIYRLLSGFGRLTYSYDDKYLFTGTFRADGSSKFYTGNKWGFFPGASVAWRISREEFFKEVTAVSDLKLRLSYGEAGNNRINDFLYDQLFQAGSAPYSLNNNIVLGSAATTLPNRDLKWESTTSRNIGVDLALWDNRVQVTADAYYNTTHDLLINRPIPPFLGYTSQQRNIGSTTNRGIELQVIGTIVRNENFTWTATANGAINRGRIESLGEGLTEIPGIASGWAGTALNQDFVAQVGQPIGQIYGYVTDGYLTADDFTGYVPATTPGGIGSWTPRTDQPLLNNLGLIGETAFRPGLIKLKDLNGDGKIDAQDQTVIGNTNPKLVGGLNQQFTYKNFDASIFLNFVLGNKVYNANKIEFTTNTANTAFNNVLDIMADRYRILEADGSPITTLDRLREVNQNANIWTPTRGYFMHSWAVEDGSFLRVNNLTLGYTVPKAVTQRAKINNLRFYVTANNLYTFTKYTGYDPEVSTRRASPLTPGVDYAAYPRSRAFLFGVNLSL